MKAILLVLAACGGPRSTAPVVVPVPADASIDAAIDASTAAAAREVIDRAIAAKGKPFAAAQLGISTEVTFPTGEPIAKERGSTTITMPDIVKRSIYRITATGHSSTRSLYLSKDKGVESFSGDRMPGRERNDPPQTIGEARGKQLRDALWRDVDVVLVHAAEPTAHLALLPDETIDGVPCRVVTIVDPSNVLVKLYIDAATSLIKREVSGSWQLDVSAYDDFDGTKIAQQRVERGGDLDEHEVAKIEVVDVVITPASR